MAKNIFGVANTSDQLDGQAFVTREAPEELLEKMNSDNSEEDLPVGEYTMSMRLKIFLTISVIACALLLFVTNMQAREAGITDFVGLIKAYPFSFVLVLVLLIAIVGLSVYMKIVENKNLKKEAESSKNEEDNPAEEEIYRYLNVPEDAAHMDLLTSTYQIKNGSEYKTVHTVFEFHAWTEDGKLCLADAGTVVEIPLEEITGSVILPKRVAFYFWNKEESPKSERYREYRIRPTGLGQYSVRNVRIVSISSQHGSFELLVPPYEIDVFNRLTGFHF